MKIATKGLLVGATAMQLALTSAAGLPAPPVEGDVGRGDIKAAGVCAVCLAGGIISVANGGLTALAITLAIGGPAAVGAVSTISACAYACYQAVT